MVEAAGRGCFYLCRLFLGETNVGLWSEFFDHSERADLAAKNERDGKRHIGRAKRKRCILGNGSQRENGSQRKLIWSQLVGSGQQRCDECVDRRSGVQHGRRRILG